MHPWGGWDLEGQTETNHTCFLWSLHSPSLLPVLRGFLLLLWRNLSWPIFVYAFQKYRAEGEKPGCTSAVSQTWRNVPLEQHLFEQKAQVIRVLEFPPAVVSRSFCSTWNHVVPAVPSPVCLLGFYTAMARRQSPAAVRLHPVWLPAQGSAGCVPQDKGRFVIFPGAATQQKGFVTSLLHSLACYGRYICFLSQTDPFSLPWSFRDKGLLGSLINFSFCFKSISLNA